MKTFIIITAVIIPVIYKGLEILASIINLGGV